MVNLRELAKKIESGPHLDHQDAASLVSCAAVAEQMAADVDLFLDGENDGLADLLRPVVEFLQKLAGVRPEDGPCPTCGRLGVGDRCTEDWCMAKRIPV